MRINHAQRNAHQQFRKPAIKIRASAWWCVTRCLKGMSTGAIANLPYQVKGFDCFCGFQFEWYLHQINHAHSPCQGQCSPALSKTCDKNTSKGMMMGYPLFESNLDWSNSKFTIPGEGIWLLLWLPIWMFSPPNLPSALTMPRAMCTSIFLNL